MIEVRKCTARELFEDPEWAELVEEYSKECGLALIGKPAPRLDVYENLERAVAAQCFGVWQDGKLTGFAMVLCSVVPHYSLNCANTESLFVRNGCPGGTTLMAAVDRHAAEAGATAIFYSAPVRSRLARLLFLCADEYVNTNHVFAKRLTA